MADSPDLDAGPRRVAKPMYYDSSDLDGDELEYESDTDFWGASHRPRPTITGRVVKPDSPPELISLDRVPRGRTPLNPDSLSPWSRWRLEPDVQPDVQRDTANSVKAWLSSKRNRFNPLEDQIFSSVDGRNNIGMLLECVFRLLRVGGGLSSLEESTKISPDDVKQLVSDMIKRLQGFNAEATKKLVSDLMSSNITRPYRNSQEPEDIDDMEQEIDGIEEGMDDIEEDVSIREYRSDKFGRRDCRERPVKHVRISTSVTTTQENADAPRTGNKAQKDTPKDVSEHPVDEGLITARALQNTTLASVGSSLPSSDLDLEPSGTSDDETFGRLNAGLVHLLHVATAYGTALKTRASTMSCADSNGASTSDSNPSRANKPATGSSSNQSGSNPEGSNDRGVNPKKRSRGDDSEDGGSEPPRRRQRIKAPQDLAKNLACPFAKGKPREYRDCLYVNRQNLAGVREHLKRNHFFSSVPPEITRAKTWDQLFMVCNKDWPSDQPIPSPNYDPYQVHLLMETADLSNNLASPPTVFSETIGHSQAINLAGLSSGPALNHQLNTVNPVYITDPPLGTLQSISSALDRDNAALDMVFDGFFGLIDENIPIDRPVHETTNPLTSYGDNNALSENPSDPSNSDINTLRSSSPSIRKTRRPLLKGEQKKYVLSIVRNPAMKPKSSTEKPGTKKIFFNDIDEFEDKFESWMNDNFHDPAFCWKMWELQNPLTNERFVDTEAVIDALEFIWVGYRSTKAAFYLVPKSSG